MVFKKGDFIELDYTGRVKEEDMVFDTTDQKIAEDSGLLHKHEPGRQHDHSDQYSPVVVSLGENHLLPGLDAKIVGKEKGKHKIELAVEEGFGKKDAKLINTFPMSFFKKQDIRPYVGLQLNFDNRIGVIRSVGAGRVMVDFNHPLSGKELVYDIDIRKQVTDKEEQLKALLKMIQLPFKSHEVKDNKVTIKYEKELPEQYLDMLKEDIKRLIGFDTEFKKVKNEDDKKQ